ncbi:P27 family phage terminase small subunit [Clostridium tetani]|uniref:P27 family phage terminase small subunit n=1 Tax=Clostridium tetani TaxID=1513 RepID=UPI001672103F|nr:P27 family phage terminase small subunit [Clostridium tetani]
MDEKERMLIRDNAYKDYVAGNKYKDIAKKYDVSINTVKSWKRRYGWQRKTNTKKGAKVQELQQTAKDIKKDLLEQLEENEIYGKHYEDLVNDYMALWDIKNRLIADIRQHGVSIEWNNGKQRGKKKNDSVPELNKTSAQMLKILSELGLKPSPKENGGEDEYDEM